MNLLPRNGWQSLAPNSQWKLAAIVHFPSTGYSFVSSYNQSFSLSSANKLHMSQFHKMQRWHCNTMVSFWLLFACLTSHLQGWLLGLKSSVSKLGNYSSYAYLRFLHYPLMPPLIEKIKSCFLRDTIKLTLCHGLTYKFYISLCIYSR